MDCPCKECNFTLVDRDLILLLEKLREELGEPLRINSGYRCSFYQQELRNRGYETSSGVSQHELGMAADVMSEGLTGKELEEAARAVGFRAVGVGGTWVHLDIRMDKDRSWAYASR